MYYKEHLGQERFILPMTTIKINPPKSSIELAEEFVSIVQHSRQYLLKPMCCVTTLEIEGVYCGAVLCLYAAETHSISGDIKQIPLTPYFYPQGVADSLEGSGIIKPVHETKRTGVLTTWYEISPTLI